MRPSRTISWSSTIRTRIRASVITPAALHPKVRAALLVVLENLLRGADAVVLDDEVDLIVRVSEADQDSTSSGVADDVGERLASQDIERLFRFGAEAKRLTADHQVRLQVLRLAGRADEAPELREESAGGRPGQRESEDGLSHRLRGMDRQLPDIAQVGRDRLCHLLAIEDFVDLEAEREYGLLDPVVELGRDPLALLAKHLFTFGQAQVAMQLFQLVDHLPLALVEPCILDRDRDLVRERGKQPLLVRGVVAGFVSDSDHTDHVLANLEGNTHEFAHRWVPARLADAVGIVEDVVGDLRAAVGDHDPEDAGPHRYQPEVFVEARIGGLEALDRGDVHLLLAVDEADESER